MVGVIGIGLIVGGLFIVHIETRLHVERGTGVPLLRGVGWLIAGFGCLIMLGLITGRGG